MVDRDKAMNGLERCLSGKVQFGCGKCPYFGDETYNDAWSCRLSLMQDCRELIEEYKGLVCCHDCKNYDRDLIYCNKFGIQNINDGWFCADGERKEGR